MIVTGHQVNFLPGMSVMEKVREADAVIWLDAMQYEKNGFVNRNRFDDGAWMTIPVESKSASFAPINRVRIADPDFHARRKISKTIEQKIGADRAAPFVQELLRPYPLLVGLNLGLLARLVEALRIETDWYLQTHVDVGWHPVPVVSDDDDVLEPAKNRLASMVEAVGGTVWLSGRSGRRYLDEAPFRERGIEVVYFDYQGPNPTALQALA